MQVTARALAASLAPASDRDAATLDRDATASNGGAPLVIGHVARGEAPAWLARCLDALARERKLDWSAADSGEPARDPAWVRFDAWLARRVLPSSRDAWTCSVEPHATRTRDALGAPNSPGARYGAKRARSNDACALRIDVDGTAGPCAETVWSVRFGDGSRYANELARGDQTLRIELHERAPDGTERCLAKTRTKSPNSLTLARSRAAWKASALLERTLRRHLAGEPLPSLAPHDSPLAHAAESRQSTCDAAGPPLARDTDGRSPELGASTRPLAGNARTWPLAVRALARAAERSLCEDAWRLAWRARGEGLPDSATWRPEHQLAAPRGRFFADPFLLAHAGRECLFFEDYDARSRLGRLACVELAADGSAGPVQPVSHAAHHLSYPFVFEHEGVAYMLPETHETRRIELWRAEKFPTRWKLDRVLIDGLKAVDATWFRHAELFWIFACVADERAPLSEELCAFWSPHPFGPWTPHAANPIVDDPCGARPAGRPFVVGGALVRPAQDVTGEYGKRVLFQELVHLDPTRYEERNVGSFDADGALASAGTHHFDRGARFEVVDARTTRFKRPRWFR
ncbi:MAG: hypothetical protein HZA52_11075 [Planctomycetes bacterium]|nr:hypothetical protein [Planctomycetota bacterium]